MVFLLTTGWVNLISAEENLGSQVDGEKAFLLGNYVEAEKIFRAILEREPNNFITLKAQANIMIKLKKYDEAEKLLDKILAMPLSTGRDILIYTEGESEPLEAELVDENVMAMDESEKSDDAFSQFLKEDYEGPVPHYRVFLKKSGKMKLFLRSRTRLQYSGIPAATREKVEALKSLMTNCPLNTCDTSHDIRKNLEPRLIYRLPALAAFPILPLVHSLERVFDSQ